MVPPDDITAEFALSLADLNRLLDSEVFMASLSAVQRQTLRLIASQTEAHWLAAELQQEIAGGTTGLLSD